MARNTLVAWEHKMEEWWVFASYIQIQNVCIPIHNTSPGHAVCSFWILAQWNTARLPITSYDARTKRKLSQQETSALCSLHRIILKGVKTMWMPSFIFQTTKLHFEPNDNELKWLFHLGTGKMLRICITKSILLSLSNICSFFYCKKRTLF